jgi:glycine cleavage system aminomethyltransferase T
MLFESKAWGFHSELISNHSKYDQEAGWITSAVHGQADDGIIAMGFVRRRYLNIGDRLTVEMDGAQIDAGIVALPFYASKSSS